MATMMLSTFSGFCSTASLQMVVDSGITPLLIEVVMAPASQPAGEARTERDERDWAVSTLTALARTRPRSLEEMASISGVGEVKLARYGEAFVTKIAAFEEDTS